MTTYILNFIVLLLYLETIYYATATDEQGDPQNIFLDKVKSSIFLKRTKRTLKEECLEGCSHEELVEAYKWVKEADRENLNPEEIREYLEPNPQHCQQHGRRIHQLTDCILPEFCTGQWALQGDSKLCPGFLPPRVCCANSSPNPTMTTTTISYTTNESFACDPRVDLDLMVVLDGSKEIRRKQLTDAKHIIRNFLNEFEVSPSRTRLGFLSFARYGKLWACFFQNFTTGDIKNFVNGVERGLDISRVERGLQKVLNRAFLERTGDRPNIPTVTVVFTDKYTGKDPRRLQKYASLIKRKSNMYVVGMGHRLIDPVLNIVASRPENIFNMYGTGFNGRYLAHIICRDNK